MLTNDANETEGITHKCALTPTESTSVTSIIDHEYVTNKINKLCNVV